MKILIVTPRSETSSGLVTGNDITAQRWEELLRKLGHEVTRAHEYDGGPSDALVALHARKSAESVTRFAHDHPRRPVIVALTGTDIYGDTARSPEVAESLRTATHVVTLQPGALDVLDPSVRPKTTVIYQSAKPIVPALEKAANCFQVSLVAHLRPVKDPFLAAEAAERLDPSSQIQVVHAGGVLDEALRSRAEETAKSNPRYRWIGPLSHEESRLLIARSHLLLLTSRSEGGANVLSEALALGIPILATRVPGVEGLLGSRYPGYVPPGDAGALAERLEQAEHDEVFYRRLELACEKLAPMVSPAWELRSWQQLLTSIF